MRIGFFGAAGEVTGSCYLVETERCRFLVDCGMFQGGSDAYRKNLRALSSLAFDVRTIDFVLVTHAHIDHSGLLPRLAVMGYKGPVYTTPATIELLEVLLPDSAHIQEKESEWQLRHQHRRGKSFRGIPAPLYTVAQAQACLQLLQPAEYGEMLAPAAGVRCCFRDAGHILGSAILEVWLESAGETRKVVFSGDLGMPDRLVLRDPESIREADVVLVESTYGNRLHRPMAETQEELVAAFKRTFAAGGNLIIPAFAVGRTQEIIYVMADLIRRGRLPATKVYVDSPMALAATRITLNHKPLLDEETRSLIEWQHQHPERMAVEFVADVEASKALNEVRHGAVIISASGMCEAGRIKYHLRENLPRPECTILITGFQAAGTLGRRLVDGARLVRIFGEQVPVRASIHTVGGLSAHADQAALLAWLGGFRHPPRQTFVVHGEADSAEALAGAIEQRLGWRNVVRPRQDQFIGL